jgi:hypothetical protein
MKVNYKEDVEVEGEDIIKLQKKRKRIVKIKRGVNCHWSIEEVIIKI